MSSETDQRSDEQFRSYGSFDPLEAKRLLKFFEEAGIRFQIDTESTMRPMGVTRLKRYNSVEILVYQEDDKRARRILREQLRVSN